LRLPRGEDDLARERYLLYACVSRATERLVLSYRSSDEEGNVALSSPFVADVAELLDEQWRSSRRRRLLADVVWPAAAAPTARERARADAAARSRSSSGPPARTLGDGGSSEPLPPLTEVALRRMRHREIVSAGALESYADCPVKWLVERELQPQRLEPDADPVVRGEVMHAVLEETLRRLAGPVTRGSLPAAERVMAHALAEQADLVGRGRPEGVRAAALRAIEADLRRYLEHEAGAGCSWTPEGLELRFGFEDEERESLGPLELGEGVALRGVIDRLDVEPMGGTRAIVRDYKSGSARSEHPAARWQPDRQLQVALYMLAVQRLLGLEPVAGVYQPLGGADLRARGMFLKGAPVGRCVVSNDARDAAELEQALEDARQRAISLARRLRSGELTPCPQTCSKGGCLYPGICRVE
jgi:RecB family exonuclease